jgi:beta-glucosidase-like glycosyl hydrolase
MKTQTSNIIFGLAGTKLQSEEKEFFLKAKPLGFILFSRNVESREQLIALSNSLKGLFPERKTFIFVDQEGGRVARIKPPIAEKLYPAAKVFADMYLGDQVRAKSAAKENWLQIMADLNSLGIDSPCAPVCDIYYPEADPIIGDRSFGSTPEQVIDLCKEAIAGINEQGGIAFIKHVPGHGRAEVDSHLALPIINTDLKTLEETDFKVFKELSSEEVWGMSAHIVYNALDSKKPATLSDKVIDYIRNKIGFKGILVTDDICMYALHGKVGQQKSLLATIFLALQNKEWKNEYQEDFKKLFAIDIADKEGQEIIDICQKEQELIKPLFCKSLATVTKEAIVAGCDIVLHCSADLQEMEAVYRAAEVYQRIN